NGLVRISQGLAAAGVRPASYGFSLAAGPEKRKCSLAQRWSNGQWDNKRACATFNRGPYESRQSLSVTSTWTGTLPMRFGNFWSERASVQLRYFNHLQEIPMVQS